MFKNHTYIKEEAHTQDAAGQLRTVEKQELDNHYFTLSKALDPGLRTPGARVPDSAFS